MMQPQAVDIEKAAFRPLRQKPRAARLRSRKTLRRGGSGDGQKCASVDRHHLSPD